MIGCLVKNCSRYSTLYPPTAAGLAHPRASARWHHLSKLTPLGTDGLHGRLCVVLRTRSFSPVSGCTAHGAITTSTASLTVHWAAIPQRHDRSSGSWSTSCGRFLHRLLARRHGDGSRDRSRELLLGDDSIGGIPTAMRMIIHAGRKFIGNRVTILEGRTKIERPRPDARLIAMLIGLPYASSTTTSGSHCARWTVRFRVFNADVYRARACERPRL